MISLAFNAAISNEVATVALLQFDLVNFCDTTGSTTWCVVRCVVIICAHTFIVALIPGGYLPINDTKDGVTSGSLQS